MNRMTRHLAAATLVALASAPAGPAFAQEDPKTGKDLATVIALQGKPCGGVTDYDRRAENDYIVSCESGDRYRVYVNASNRVVVEKQ